MKNPTAELVGTPSSLISTTVLDSIKKNIIDAKSITIVTGYITQEGWKLLRSTITAAIKRKCLVRLFSDSRPINTDYSLLFKLNRILNKKGKNFYGMVFDGADISMLHAKFLIFDKPENKSVIIASSANITRPALLSNLEIGIKLETQTNRDLYKNISHVIATLEKYSHEPTEEENNDYLKFKQQIEESRLLLQTSYRVSGRWKKDKKIFAVKEFRNNIKQDFNDPHMLKVIQRLSNTEVGAEQDNTGKAITNFTQLVLENKKRFSNIDNFKLMLRIYANILNYSMKKPLLENLLQDLSTQINIKKNIVNQIYNNSVPGRYLGLTRGVREPYKIKPTHIEATLYLINKFYDGTDYETLLDAFIKFDKKTKQMQPRGIGLITGILASLKPIFFVVCNRRTRTLRKISKQAKYRRILGSDSFENYPTFNEIFRYLSERSGIDNLRTLDLISSEIYVELKRQ